MLHVEMLTAVFLLLWMCVFCQDPSSKTVADRYAVYWNSTNPSSSNSTLEGLDLQNDGEWFLIVCAQGEVDENDRFHVLS
ncbi:hypothetical protein JRQ81_013661 [Phrynocephalus forsythii]|uniref:Uncharacterized protein n=1 Tax=Phrynocephalus forsythii TaxID=171643 RepID=A0A9Q0XZL7_9SAUR|nr:hypothetical protein JRQ81_013661 [Phrynocephalus forsythii]